MSETNQPKIHIHHNSYLNELIYDWFVRYNPLYFVSAACFIFGVLLVSRGIQSINWIDGQILLTAVIELYQLGLLAGAFVLYRIFNQRRPAVILAIMNIVFLFDCTYQTEHISSVPVIGEIAIAVWVFMVAVKMIALVWIFRIKVPVIGLLLPVLGAIGIVTGPYLLYYTYFDATFIHLIMTWYGVILAVVYFWFRPIANCKNEPDYRCGMVLDRITHAAWMIWAGFYLFHLISWIRFHDINVSLANLAPVFIILPFVAKREELTWIGCLAAFLVSLVNPSFFSINAFLVGFVFCVKAWKDRYPRFYIGGILSFHFALTSVMWSGGPFPESSLMMILLSALLLVAVGLAYRLISAFIIAAIWVLIFWHPRGPRDIMEWGGLFIGIGFLSLVTGVILNWKYRATIARNENSPGSPPSKNGTSPAPANGLPRAQAVTTPRDKVARDLNGFCPYCMIHLNAGKSRCDKCGKSFI